MSRIVIALGGNALGNTPEQQLNRINEITPSLVGLIKQGHEIIITHGNGPQVGMLKNALDNASKLNNDYARFPLTECTALSQGYIGYHLQNGILKELKKEGMPWQVATIITQIEVNKNDNAFLNPQKPIGAFLTKEDMELKRKINPDYVFKEDSGRGYRQVVASPRPIDIIEKKSILHLLDNEFIVIACGGGGIPVIKNEQGDYVGIQAVIDKDFASALLAKIVDAEYLFILTAVDYVCINYNTPSQKILTSLSINEAKEYIKDNQFGEGSMKPKVEAAISFVEFGENKKAVIASLEKAPLAMQGLSGTVIYK